MTGRGTQPSHSPWSTYAPGRGADHAVGLLKDFSGVLQTDGYAVYQSLARARNDNVLAQCWALARSKFFDLARGGSAPIATEAMARISQLYADWPLERILREAAVGWPWSPRSPACRCS